MITVHSPLPVRLFSYCAHILVRVFRVFILGVLLTTASAIAQARSNCPMHPNTLLAMRGCYRPLLVFAPDAADGRIKRQQVWLDQAADDMMDRNVLYLPILPPAIRAGLKPPLDAPFSLLTAQELASVRRSFRIAQSSFAVVLLGEDGAVKLRSSQPVPV